MQLDTASTSVVVVARHIPVIGVVWDPGTGAANADQAILKNRFGDIVWSTTLITGNLVPASFAPATALDVDGLIMHTLTRGTVYVYLDT